MPIVTLEQAKTQLNIGELETDDDVLISGFINAAIGMVEQKIEKDIYEFTADIPADSVNTVDFEKLKESKQASLSTAVLLALSSLYLYRESDLDIDLTQNPAFMACLNGFIDVVVG